MEVMVSRGCGLDVHQATVVASLLVGEPGALPRKQVKTFSTMTSGLIELRDWLKAADCTAVAMEATGVYWKPVYNILEGHFDLIVANARHIKAVPGRKTDVKDAEWIADLLRHGLLQPSYVPPPELRELRSLLRYRVKLVNARSARAQSDHQAARERQYQTLGRHFGPLRRLGAAHARRAQTWCGQRGRDGRTGQKATAIETPTSEIGARWAPGSASSAIALNPNGSA